MTTPPAPTPEQVAVQLSLYRQFRKFLLETNAMALAIAVIIGAAAGKLVTSLVDGLIMPLISLIIPGGDWKAWKIVLEAGTPGPDGTTAGEKAIMVGNILAASLDFIIVAAVVFFIGAKLLKIEIKK